MSAELDAARSLVAGAGRIVALTGAGISTDSGIPDFRGPNGVWTKNPAAEKLSTLSDYLASKEIREQTWLARRDNAAWRATPNRGHRALVELERAGKLAAVLTQNIDGLHQRAGSDPGLVVELHGNMFGTVCLSCGDRDEMTVALARVAAGESDPPCARCGGIIKSATISFGQALDEQVLETAYRKALACDLMLAVGSSLTVHPAAGLVGLAAESGAEVIICNAEPTPYDEIATVVLTDPIGEVLPALVHG